MTFVDPHERVGTVIGGRYRIDRVLGQGGMGVVLAGTHALTDRRVAVKLLLPQFAQEAEVLARFFQEAKSAAGLNHPNVVDTLDMGVEDEQPYLVLELLEGEDLGKKISREGPIPEEALLPLVLPVIDALAAAHEHGIVHRDLKPENIFVSKDARGRMLPKVLDFGIAKLIEGESAVQTRAGGVVGTPTYMSPEQAMGRAGVGPPSDVWSMGVVLYECLGGRVPFSSETLTGVLMKICREDPPPLLEVAPFVHPAIARVVHGAMQRVVEERIQTMVELGTELTTAAKEAGIELPKAVAGLFEESEEPVIELRPSSRPPPAKHEARGTSVLEEPEPEPDAYAHTVLDEMATPVSEPPPARRRGGLWLGGLMAVLGLAGGAAFWFLGPGMAPSGPASTAEVAPASPEAETAAVQEVPVPSRSIMVASEPVGAIAWRGDVQLGTTPLEVSVPAGGIVQLELRLAGHESQVVTLTADSPSNRRVRLSPEEPSAEELAAADAGEAELTDEEEAATEEPAAEPVAAEEAVSRRATQTRPDPERRSTTAPAARRRATRRPTTAQSTAEARAGRESLDTSRGQVVVRADGGWAEVFLGRRSLGRTPLRTHLPVGAQRLRILPHGQGTAQYVNVDITWGEVVEVRVHVEPALSEPAP